MRVFKPYRVTRREQERKRFVSLYLEPLDGRGLQPFFAGQHLPVRVPVGQGLAHCVRAYSLSAAPGRPYYRLTVKRAGGGGVSNALCRHTSVGSTIYAASPAGDFVLDGVDDAPVVLISAGSGIAPFASMIEAMAERATRGGGVRETSLFHVTLNGSVDVLSDRLRALDGQGDWLKAHVQYLSPTKDDTLGETFDAVGMLHAETVMARLSPAGRKYYVAGPRVFVIGFVRELLSGGVAPSQVQIEPFD